MYIGQCTPLLREQVNMELEIDWMATDFGSANPYDLLSAMPDDFNDCKIKGIFRVLLSFFSCIETLTKISNRFINYYAFFIPLTSSVTSNWMCISISSSLCVIPIQCFGCVIFFRIGNLHAISAWLYMNLEFYFNLFIFDSNELNSIPKPHSKTPRTYYVIHKV